LHKQNPDLLKGKRIFLFAMARLARKSILPSLKKKPGKLKIAGYR